MVQPYWTVDRAEGALKSTAASEPERTALSQKETATPGIPKPTAYRSTTTKRMLFGLNLKKMDIFLPQI